MNTADVYAAYARLLLPQEGDPDPAETLRALPDGEELGKLRPRNLMGEYLKVFGPAPSGAAPPYETYYGGSAHIFMQSQQLADLGGFYRAFGLETPSAERPDHLAAELEFLHYLNVKEAYAREHAGEEEVQICREAQRTFLGEHLGRWIHAFSVRMKEHDASSFYTRLAAGAADFVKRECERLGVQVVAVSPAEMQIPELDPDDGGCAPCMPAQFQQ